MPRTTAPAAPAAPRLARQLTPAGHHELGPETLLEDRTWTGLDAPGLDAELSELSGVAFVDGTLAGSAWRKANWLDVSGQGLDLSNADFEGAGWTRVLLERSRLTGLLLPAAHLTDVEVGDSVLSLASLRAARLRRCRFVGCRLDGADFSGATLTDVEFVDSDLSGATFDQATTTRVHFRSCDLTGLQGVSSLAGSTIDPANLVDVAHLLAAALRIGLAGAD